LAAPLRQGALLFFQQPQLALEVVAPLGTQLGQQGRVVGRQRHLVAVAPAVHDMPQHRGRVQQRTAGMPGGQGGQ